jgi:hypothetical protein
MPEVAESDARDYGAANEVAERCSEVPRDDSRTVRASEDESVVMVGGSQERLYPVLLGSVLSQDNYERRPDGERALAISVRRINASPAAVCCSERPVTGRSTCDFVAAGDTFSRGTDRARAARS